MGKPLRHIGYHLHVLQSAADFPDYCGPRQLVIPVLRERGGIAYLLIAGRGELFGVPYATDADPLIAADGTEVDVFLDLKSARDQGVESGLEYILRHLIAGAALSKSRQPTRRGGAPSGTGHGSSASAPGMVPEAPRQRRLRSLDPLQTNLLSGALANLAAGDGLQIYELAGGLASQMVGGELRECLGDLLGLGGLDDSSSSADYLEQMALSQVADLATSALMSRAASLVGLGAGDPGILNSLQTMLKGETSSAELGACATGHLDSGGNQAFGDEGLMVKVEGNPVLVAYDDLSFVSPPMKRLLNGSTTVLSNGLYVSRCGAATAAGTEMVVGAPSVLVGGPGLCNEAVEFGRISSEVGVPPAATMPVIRNMQAAYEEAKRQGAGEYDAERIAAAAAQHRELDPDTERTILNGLYTETEARRGTRDSRGAVVTGERNGHRVVTLLDTNRQSVDGGVDIKKGDIIRVDATGEEFSVEAVVHDPSGLSAYILVDPAEPGRSRLVFSGTDEGKDWLTNLEQGLGLVPDQYRRAAELAEEFRLSHPGGGILGHSLGGGLAAYAGLLTGLPTRIVNPAGLGDGTLNDIYERGVNTTLANIQTTIVDGEMLDVVQMLGISPASAGTVERYPGNPRPGLLPIPILGEIYSWISHAIAEHKMPAVLQAVQDHDPIRIEVVKFRTPS